MVLADYAAYIECQEKVNQAFKDREKWTQMSLYNTANMEKFSADRAVMEYAEEIWKIKPLEIPDSAAILQCKISQE